MLVDSFKVFVLGFQKAGITENIMLSFLHTTVSINL